MTKNVKITLLSISLFFTGCAVNSYNTPFINTDETLKLEYGMDKTSVYNKLGQPLYVEMGEQGAGSIVWIYEVRTIEVESKVEVTGESSPRKTYSKIRHGAPIHKLRIEFLNNKVVTWGPLAEDKNIVVSNEDGKKNS